MQRLSTTLLPRQLPSLEISATAHVGGYIARVINEHMLCGSCTAICSKPASNQPIFQLTHSQDRGGLLYPSNQLLFALDVLRSFADRALKDNPTLQKILSTLVEHAVPALCASNRVAHAQHRNGFGAPLKRKQTYPQYFGLILQGRVTATVPTQGFYRGYNR